MVGRGEIEVDAAEGALGFGLAEDDGDLFVQRDAMPEVRAPVLVSFNSFLHQGYEGALALLRGFIEADDVLLESLHGFRDLGLE